MTKNKKYVIIYLYKDFLMKESGLLAKVKCLICGVTFDRQKEDNIKIGNRYVHKNCIANTEEGNKLELELYIKNIMNLDKITPLIKSQINKYYTENKYSYKSIMYTLKYFYELQNGDITKAKGIGIVPFVYDEAKKYYEHLNKVTINIDKIKNINKYTNKEREIIIFSPKQKINRKKINLIQIEGEI